ncbi:hypothetical protein NL676_018674 [Syzygium grande]|nr:hypothetical protein NL676_018674 [Syzygium grande]
MESKNKRDKQPDGSSSICRNYDLGGGVELGRGARRRRQVLQGPGGEPNFQVPSPTAGMARPLDSSKL